MSAGEQVGTWIYLASARRSDYFDNHGHGLPDDTPLYIAPPDTAALADQIVGLKIDMEKIIEINMGLAAALDELATTANEIRRRYCENWKPEENGALEKAVIAARKALKGEPC